MDGAVGVSAVAFGNEIAGQAGNDEKATGYDGRMPDRVGHDGEEIPGQVGYDGEEIPGQAGYDGERAVVDRLPLGEYIARSGYDWTAEDLADVSVDLDLERQQVMITVSDWDGVVVMDIVI